MSQVSALRPQTYMLFPYDCTSLFCFFKETARDILAYFIGPIYTHSRSYFILLKGRCHTFYYLLWRNHIDTSTCVFYLCRENLLTCMVPLRPFWFCNRGLVLSWHWENSTQFHFRHVHIAAWMGLRTSNKVCRMFVRDSHLFWCQKHTFTVSSLLKTNWLTSYM